jgi:hypothetical protein
MLPVSLDCLRPVSCVPHAASVSRLSSSCVLCTQWQSRDTGSMGYTRHRTKTIQRHCLVYPMLPVSLDCFRPVSCVPHAASVSRLSSSCVLCTQCCQCLWIAHSWFPPSVFSNVYSNPLFIVDLIHLGTQDTGRRQSRDTGSMGYTRHRTKTI